MKQEGNPHPALALLSRVVEGDGALPLPVLTPVLKLRRNKERNGASATFISVQQKIKVSMLAWTCLSLTFLKMFMPRSEDRSGTACRRRLVRDTFANVSELRDFPSSLHFRLMSCRTQQRRVKGRNDSFDLMCEACELLPLPGSCAC